MSKVLRVLRTEKKHNLPKLLVSELKSKLSMIMKGDPVNGYKPYLVRSLYFDTIYNDDFFEKMAGVERRRKVRLRVYDPNANSAKLEIKEKQGPTQLKRSMLLTREEAIRIQNCDYEVLKEKDDELAMELYYLMTTKQYRPVCIVEYDRVAFAHPTNDIRITFDSNIRSNEGNFSVFDPMLQCYPVYPMRDTIMEIKYNGFMLSYIKDVIGSLDCHETAVSKYCMARRYGLGGE